MIDPNLSSARSRAPRTSPPGRSRGLRLAAIGAATALLVAVPLPALADVTFDPGDDSILYTEGGEPINIGRYLTIDDPGTVYGGGYIEFEVTGDGRADTRLSLETDAAASTALGVITIVGDTVYRGNGTTADIIGSVDETVNGANGVLRVNFTSPFSNSSFEGGLDGWHPLDQRVDLGVTQLWPGQVPVDTNTYPSPTGGRHDDYPPQSSATYQVSASSAEHTDGARSLQLYSTMNTTDRGFDVVHGPAVYSDPFPASTGDQIYFDWRAQAGQDAYDVFGYIVNETTGQQTVVLDATGIDDRSGSPWATVNTTIPSDGSYRFVFVSGTFDFTGGQAAGATLYIDNVRVYGQKANDEAATEIAHKLLYENLSDNPPTGQGLSVTIDDGDDSTPPDELDGDTPIDIEITPVDDPPAFTGGDEGTLPAVDYTNEEDSDGFPSTTGSLGASDPDTGAGDLTYGLPDGETVDETIGGVHYDLAQEGDLGTLYLDSDTGAYLFVPDEDAIHDQLVPTTETFTVTVSDGESTTTAVLPIAIDVAATAPSAPRELAATAGDAQATLRWDAPAWLGGEPVTGYKIESSVDGGPWTTITADTASDATTYVATGLANGTPIAFRISAINANGTGDPSDTASTTPRTVPGAPTGLAATPGNASADLTWTAPTETGGSAITGYRIEKSVDDGEHWTVVTADTGSTSTSATATGLDNGRSTSFRVFALNAAGIGPSSGPASTTPRTVASGLEITSVTSSNHTLTVEFAPPTDDGGAEVTGYEYSIDGGESWIPFDETESPLVIRGLENGADYPVTIRAVNEAGPGPEAEVSVASPELLPVTVPGEDGPALPELEPGEAELYIDGEIVPVTITDEHGVWTATGDGFAITLEIVSTSGAPAARDADGRIVVTQGESFRVTGSGFQPGSTADVWLFSTPVLLGTAPVDEDGDFAGVFRLPAGVQPGPHTVQVNGLSEDGELRTLATGVVVRAAPLIATGVEALGLGSAAALLLAAGIGLVTVRRRRTRA